ncbi:MAG: hypothetical protein J5659_02965 [Clostridia bacterium]|nr:hypothetical protein [Clostridia bacterium]
MKEIKHISEPNPLACGQAVIAMLTGADVNKIIRLAGTDRETTLKDMKSLLSHFGYNCASGRKEAKKISDLPEIALLSLETPKCWHWSLFAYGRVYDPEYGVLDDFPESYRKYFWDIKKSDTK